MSSNQVNKFLPESRWLYSQMQSIEGELTQAPISKKKYELLTRELDKASKKLQELEKTAGVFAQAQARYLKEKVVTLSKDLVDRHVETEVSQIQRESASLQKKVSQEAVKKLETHIEQLEKDHKPSIPHRRIIADAKHTLLEAKAKLAGKPVAHHFEWLASQKNVRMVEEVELLPGEIEELFDIAKAIYDRDFRQAKARFNMLPEDHKERVRTHLKQLAAQAFEDPLETMQALIATVNELVKNGEAYPSRDQIDQLFLGLAQITQGETPSGSKIISLKKG